MDVDRKTPEHHLSSLGGDPANTSGYGESISRATNTKSVAELHTRNQEL